MESTTDYRWRLSAALLLGAAETPAPDGSVMVRVDAAYVEQMRGQGLAGPFSRVQLDERDGVPTLLLTVEPTPTPDTVEYWRAVAQELATEIHKLRGMTAPMEATDDYANTKRWAGLYSEATDGSLWAAFERGWLAAGGRPPFAEPPAAPPTGEAGTANHQRNIITAALKRCHRLLEQAVGHVNPEEDPALVDAIQAELMPCDEANICPALAAPVPAAPPDLVELVRRVIAAHTKETVTRAAWADKTEPWSPESGQMFEAVLAREAETREAFSALAAYPLTPKEDTNG